MARPAVAADKYYSSDPATLTQQVSACLARPASGAATPQAPPAAEAGRVLKGLIVSSHFLTYNSRFVFGSTKRRPHRSMGAGPPRRPPGQWPRGGRSLQVAGGRAASAPQGLPRCCRHRCEARLVPPPDTVPVAGLAGPECPLALLPFAHGGLPARPPWALLQNMASNRPTHTSALHLHTPGFSTCTHAARRQAPTACHPARDQPLHCPAGSVPVGRRRMGHAPRPCARGR